MVPIVTATWQAGLLSGLSNILGQFIKCYQANRPFTLNTTELGHFILFAFLSCPPNFLWQTWLEDRFPGYTRPKDDPEKGDKQLNLRNTAAKFALDQTIGATVNTLLFIGGMDLLRGRSTAVIMTDCRDEFWPLVFAGLKLWPAVSIASFTIVPVEYRVVFGSIIGLFWGAYLSMLTGTK